MGCTVREKKTKSNRRGKSAMKPSSSSDELGDYDENCPTSMKSMLESGLKPWTYNMGFDENNSSGNKSSDDNFNSGSNPNNLGNCSSGQSPNFDEYGWGFCTEEQLMKILLKQLEHLYNEAISKLYAMGYDEDVALKAVLRNGHCYGGMNVSDNILHNALTYLNSGNAKDDFIFSELKQLEEYTLAGMVYLLQQVRPYLSRGDAMWCLLMSDLHVGRACTVENPMLHPPNNESGEPDHVVSNVDSVQASVDDSEIHLPPGLCKFHGGWGFANRPDSKASVSGIDELFSRSEENSPSESDSAMRFNLSPSMKTMLKKNVAAFAASFRSKHKRQPLMQSQPCSSFTNISSGQVSAPPAYVPNEVYDVPHGNNQDINSVLSKFRDMNLGENLECFTEEQKDEIIMTLLHQAKDLENQVAERKDWAQQKAMQAARKLNSDINELKTLRIEREETQWLQRGKQMLEDRTMKKLSEMENALRKASSQVDRANSAVRRLEIENAETRAEMEASKLSASESLRTCLEVAKREKKHVKRLVAWEKQKAKLQDDITAEKQKISSIQEELVQIKADQKEAEAKWRREVKDKELAVTQLEEERRAKDLTEGSAKRKLEALRLRIDIDFQRHKDDLERLEQDLSRLKASSQVSEPSHPSNVFISGNPETVDHQAHSIASLLHGLGVSSQEDNDRECIICMRDEVSVVFLPCAHQVMCAGCGEEYGKYGSATCPCCRVPIEQKIRVFGASS